MAEVSIPLKDVAKISRKLDRLDAKLSKKIIAQAGRDATKFFMVEMRSNIPVGKKWHKSYSGVTLQPGHAKKSIRRLTRRNKDGISLIFGVLDTAFYAINFIDLGPYTVKSRRVTRKSGLFADTTKISAGRVFPSRSIKPYTIEPKHWFLRPFIRNQGKITRNFSAAITTRIREAVR